MKKILTFFCQLVTILFVICTFSFYSFSADIKKCTQSEVDTIQSYLNNFRTLSTEFVEEYKDKKKAGKIYVKKPGLMKIEYVKPEKISIFINKDIVTYYDHELDEETKVKQDPKFLNFLSKDFINFQKDFKSFECTNDSDSINLKLSFAKQNDEEIELVMNFLKYNLNTIMIYIDQMLKTNIYFTNIAFNTEIDSNQFIFKDKKFFNIEEQ